MKKFKIFFYPIYSLIAIVTLYYGFDILSHQQDYMEKIKDFATLRKIPEYMLMIIIISSAFMIVEIIIENIHLYKWKRKAASNEAEILRLKAKLYDEGLQDKPKLEERIEEEFDEDETSNEDSDYMGMNDEEEKD